MNFLAHAFLSFNNPDILVGNMISDFVKGKSRYDFPEAIQKGIELHRRIDEFTDKHASVKEAQKVFSKDYRLYSAPLVDITLDHFLANDPGIFPGGSLQSFSNNVYETLESYSAVLPARFLQVLPYMKQQNWLYNYRTTEGIYQSLRGLVRRASFISDAETAHKLFISEYASLRFCYEGFIEDVKMHAKEQLKQLL